MKKIILIFLIFTTSVNASKVYLFKDSDNKFITNNDNYNYKDYILEKNQILIVPPENGIISNDIIKNTNYTIKVFENSENSKLEDIEYNDTTGSFSYTPSNDVVGEVSFKYYIEYNDTTSNVSYIYFYVKNTTTKYSINFYEKDSDDKIVPSIIKNTNVNQIITEKPLYLDGYNIINNSSITKKMSSIESENNFNFYYEKIPNTGI